MTPTPERLRLDEIGRIQKERQDMMKLIERLQRERDALLNFYQQWLALEDYRTRQVGFGSETPYVAFDVARKEAARVLEEGKVER